MTMMYEMVNMGMGQIARDAWVFEEMSTNYFAGPTEIGASLLSNNLPDAATLDRMYTDPVYGLSNTDNYFRWNQLITV